MLLDDPLHLHSRWEMARHHRQREIFAIVPSSGTMHCYHIRDMATYLRDLLQRGAGSPATAQPVRDPISQKILTLAEVARFYYQCERLDQQRTAPGWVPLLPASFRRHLLQLLVTKFTKHRLVHARLAAPRYLLDFLGAYGCHHQLVTGLLHWTLLHDYALLLHAFVRAIPHLAYCIITARVTAYGSAPVQTDALHIATFQQALACVDVLSARIFAPPAYALHLACLAGNLPLVQRLAPHCDLLGVSPYVVNASFAQEGACVFRSQWTPMQCAMRGRAEESLVPVARHLHESLRRAGVLPARVRQRADHHESLLYILLFNADIESMPMFRKMWDWVLAHYYAPQDFMDASTQQAVMGLASWARLLHVFESCAARGVRFAWACEAHRYDIWQHALHLYSRRCSPGVRAATQQHRWACYEPLPPIWDFLRLVALLPRVATNTAPLELWSEQGLGSGLGLFPAAAFEASPSRASFLAHWLHAQARTRADRAHVLFSVADELVSHSFEARAVEGGVYSESLWWRGGKDIQLRDSLAWTASLHHLWYSVVQQLYRQIQRRNAGFWDRGAYLDVMERFFGMTRSLGANPYVLFATYLYNVTASGAPLSVVASRAARCVAQHAGVGLWRRVRATVADVYTYETDPPALKLPTRLEGGDVAFQQETDGAPRPRDACATLHCMDTCVWLGGTRSGGLLKWQVARTGARAEGPLYAGICACSLGWKVLLWEVQPFTTLSFVVDRTLCQLTVVQISASGAHYRLSGTAQRPQLALSSRVRWTPACMQCAEESEHELHIRLSLASMMGRQNGACGFVSDSSYPEPEE